MLYIYKGPGYGYGLSSTGGLANEDSTLQHQHKEDKITYTEEAYEYHMRNVPDSEIVKSY
jgi:hypothetical protein